MCRWRARRGQPKPRRGEAKAFRYTDRRIALPLEKYRQQTSREHAIINSQRPNVCTSHLFAIRNYKTFYWILCSGLSRAKFTIDTAFGNILFKHGLLCVNRFIILKILRIIFLDPFGSNEKGLYHELWRAFKLDYSTT